MKKKQPGTTPGKTVTLNRKARHDYQLGERFEAGMALQGWEAKSLRAGHAQLQGSYVILKEGEAYLFGARFTPLPTTAAHSAPDAQRTRKLLLHRKELNKLRGAVEHRGHTLVPTVLYWKRGLAKLEIALARGKKSHDKRAALRERDWQREQRRLLKRRGRGRG